LKESNPNVKIVILEARDRIGGRVRTIQFGNCSVDLGMAYCASVVSFELILLLLFLCDDSPH
jgi:protoporphyrinogen oxidase